MTLDHDDIEAVAARLAELVADGEGGPMPHLVDAATLARILGVSRATVYARSEELGAVRVGDGPRAPLRFDPRKLTAAAEPNAAPPRKGRRRRSPAPTEGAALLPIRGRRNAAARPLRS